eukprot:9497731-Pyramimonas_sp.AAC.1
MGPDRCLLSAMLCDAFISTHHYFRLRLPGTPEQHFEARLRVLARRHAATRRVWAKLGRDFSRRT